MWLFYSKVNGSELDTHSPTHELLLLPRCPGQSLTITLGVRALGREVNGRRRRHSPRQVALCLALPPRAAAQHPQRCASHNSNHPPVHRGSKLTRKQSPPDPEVPLARRKSRPGPPRSAVGGGPWMKPRPFSVDYGGRGWSNVDAALELAARWASPRATAGNAGLARVRPRPLDRSLRSRQPLPPALEKAKAPR